jgi:hypothetical protein
MEVFPMSATITQLRKPATITKKASSRSFQKKMRRQAMSAVAIGVVAVALTALSLDHLAAGIDIVTGTSGWQSWAMAIGIDLGFITLELAQIAAATDKVSKLVSKFTKPAIVGTMAGSAIMNAFAFAASAIGYMVAPAIVLGIAIPGLIYAMTRVGAALYIDCHSKH